MKYANAGTVIDRSESRSWTRNNSWDLGPPTGLAADKGYLKFVYSEMFSKITFELINIKIDHREKKKLSQTYQPNQI